MTEKLKTLINNLKHEPGVYLMHDKDDNIIYVGKAKDLQKRVSQYFLRPQTGKVFKMVQNVDYFETILCKNEKEALVLEMNLIQTHYPKYNILLKDGKHYPYIAIKKKGDPFLTIKRNNKDKKYDYFGPYPNAGAAFSMIDLLNKVFPIRKCRNLASSTCLYYHLNQCLAPCVNKIEDDVFISLRDGIKSFMNGNNQSIKDDIKRKMLDASSLMEFETANEYKKILDSIDHINQAQNVELKDKKDRDIFAFSSRDGYLSLAILISRKGLILGKDIFIVEEFGDHEEQVSELIIQYYQKHPEPSEIIINNQNIIDSLNDVLDANIVIASKGRLLELVISTSENAQNGLDEYFASARVDDNKVSLLEELGDTLGIPAPLHIELFDNSHLNGSSPVGAMVAFINGEPAKKFYRKFKIEHQESRDDTQSMKEVIYRHYSRIKEGNLKKADLILVDGGLTQVRAALSSIAQVGINIPIFGLYKNDKHQTAGLIDSDEHTYPINDKNLFFLLTRMQDEVHRFAISFHKDKRNKAMKSSILDGIDGLGSKRKEMLLRAYSDISSLRSATIEELKQILPESVASALYKRLHSL